MINYFVPTGNLIREYLDVLGFTQKELAVRLGVSEKHLSHLVNGSSRLTEEMALKLEKVFPDMTASYWLNYEAKFREHLARENELKKFNEIDLKSISERFMFSKVFEGLGWSLEKQAIEMLKLLKIANFSVFDKSYSNLNFSFFQDGGELESIAIWLNLCEEQVDIQNLEVLGYKFDRQNLVQNITQFKDIALNPDLDNSIKTCRKLCNKLGIYLVILDAIPNSKVRGAITSYKSHPAIYISDRFKKHDNIWFAFIHEIGHLVLHYNENQQPMISLEESRKDLPCEEEANAFARNFFIDENDYKNFTKIGDFSEPSIVEFALKQNIRPGILVARLQHDKIIPWNLYSYSR